MNDDVSIMETIEAVKSETGDVSAIVPVVNTSFSVVEPILQLAHDATSMSAGKKCWRYYKYLIIDGYGLAGPDNDHLVFGKIFHAATEMYDRLLAKGVKHEEAVRHCVRYALIVTWDFELGRPWVSQEPTKNRDSLVRTIILYLDRYKDSHLETLILSDGTPAVEHSFRIDIEIKAPTGESYLVCGHIDKAVVWNDAVKIPDKKTTKYPLDDMYFKQYSPDIQMSTYTFAGKIIFSDSIDGVIIDAAQVLVNGSRFRRMHVDRSAGQLEEWFRGLTIYLRELERNVSDNYWPMNETACGFGRMQCMFRPVCSADPGVRQDILDAFYKRRPTWDPKVPRGESSQC
jgi:hypothetical protein